MTRRREFITLLGGAAALSLLRPLAAYAQQSKGSRIGALVLTDQDGRAFGKALREGLRELGLIEGENYALELRSADAKADLLPQLAQELVRLKVDVIAAIFTRPAPIGSAARNMTHGIGGSTRWTASLSGKWPELLKEIFPRANRMGIVRDPSNPAGIGQWAVIQSVALSLRLDFTPIDVRNTAEIERGIEAIARDPFAGLIVPVSSQAFAHRLVLLSNAARHRVPAVYPHRHFAAGGGLLSYGPDLINQFRQAASYVDRILRGERPADLPVQNPTKYELVINLKTAKALGLEVPPSLLARADEVIE